MSHGVTQQVVFHALTLWVDVQHPHNTTGAVISVQEPLCPLFVMTKCFSGIPSPLLPLVSVVCTHLSHVSSCWRALGVCAWHSWCWEWRGGALAYHLQAWLSSQFGIWKRNSPCVWRWATSDSFTMLNILILSPQMEPIFPRLNDNSHRGKLVSCPLCSDLIAAEHELQLGVVFQTCAPLHSDLQRFLISMITLIVASWFPVLCALTLSLSDLIALWPYRSLTLSLSDLITAEHKLQLGVAFQTCAPLCSDLIAAEHKLQLGVAFQTCA
jgi:hypothetical protein